MEETAEPSCQLPDIGVIDLGSVQEPHKDTNLLGTDLEFVAHGEGNEV